MLLSVCEELVRQPASESGCQCNQEDRGEPKELDSGRLRAQRTPVVNKYLTPLRQQPREGRRASGHPTTFLPPPESQYRGFHAVMRACSNADSWAGDMLENLLAVTHPAGDLVVRRSLNIEWENPLGRGAT